MSIFDIGANMTHATFHGYRSRMWPAHKEDVEDVLLRANDFGVKKFLISACNLKDAIKACELSKQSDNYYATIGIHPTSAKDPYKVTDKKNSEKLPSQLLDQYFGKIRDIM